MSLYGSVPAANAGTIDANGVRQGIFEKTLLTPSGRKTVLEFVNVACVLVDHAATVAYGSVEAYDFPEGLIGFSGAVADLDLTKTSTGVNADWDGDIGLGTVAADNSATLATTEQDLIPTTSTPQAVAGVTTGDCVSTTAALFDGTASAKKAYLNILVDDADQDVTSTPCNIIVNGTVTIDWKLIGDK